MSRACQRMSGRLDYPSSLSEWARWAGGGASPLFFPMLNSRLSNCRQRVIQVFIFWGEGLTCSRQTEELDGEKTCENTLKITTHDIKRRRLCSRTRTAERAELRSVEARDERIHQRPTARRTRKRTKPGRADGQTDT